MWSPTHIQVTVQRAKGLLTKGKNGTNNCFVTIGLGKEKYQTSVKEKAESNVNWNEECELKIPDQGNRAELTLTCLHRNNLGIDEFLGQVSQPLNEMDVYDRPRSKWFRLESKPGKEKKNKERGELEIRVSFVVKSGSLTDLSKKDKHKSSIGQLASSVGGSLLSIGTIEKRKGIKKFAKSLGSKMHLNGKKKNKDANGDDVSNFSGSFASIGTPNSSGGGGSGGGSGRRYGQRAGEADPGVISEDEDEFVFDNLSHKSSGSSLNVRSAAPGNASSGGLQPPTPNFVPRNPSPLLNGGGGGANVIVGRTLNKAGGKQLEQEDIIDPELEALENDFSVRARTLPPPSKPPRTPQLGAEEAEIGDEKNTPTQSEKKEHKVDEWASKIYGKHLDIGSTDSLKRRSWELAPVPLPSTAEDSLETKAAESENREEFKIQEKAELKLNEFEEKEKIKFNEKAEFKINEIADFSSSSSSESEKEDEAAEKMPTIGSPLSKSLAKEVPPQRPQELNLNLSATSISSLKVAASPKPQINLLSPDVEAKNDFNQFNASFAKFEQSNSAKIFDLEAEPKWQSPSQALIAQESHAQSPKALPRTRPDSLKLEQAKKKQEEEAEAALRLKAQQEKAEVAKEIEASRLRAVEDARLEEELLRNEEQERVLQAELRQQEEQKRREAKRREEDQRILNFSKRSTSTEDEVETEEEDKWTNEKEQSPKERQSPLQQQQQQRLGKFKYFNKRDDDRTSTPSPKSSERIIIGHEKSTSHAERRLEITAALAKKYEGKSREELMLIANGMENEALLQRQRVKELEDYLDNLLLRVMETHPKILQNPYSRTTSAKSG